MHNQMHSQMHSPNAQPDVPKDAPDVEISVLASNSLLIELGEEFR